jgi:hypothetical protein
VLRLNNRESPVELVKAFGGIQKFENVLKELENEIYNSA